MYKVYADDICIYDDSKSSNIETQLVSPKLTLADNTAGTFTATIPPTNIGYEYVSELGTTISIYRDGAWLWTGRVLSEDKDFWNNRKITCEGAMAFLNDTNQEQATYEHVSIASFITALLNRHNAKVESNRQIFVGEITVIDTEDPLTTYMTDYATTLSYLNEKLLDVFGGHMRIRQENGVNYLDYLAIDDEHPVHTSTQTIDFGKNLLDFTKKFDAEKFATVLLPLGAQADDGRYVTVRAVNHDSPYVPSSAVETYGWIEKVIHFDNVAMPWRLMEKAQEYLADLQFDSVVIELKAVDLHYLDPDYEPFDILDHVRVVSQPHGMDRAFQITKIDIPLDNPENVAYTLGGTVAQSFTSRYSSSVTTIKETIKSLPTESSILGKAKAEATDLINNATQGYITITKTEDGSQELYITDTANYQNATKIWRWNLGGLGYSGDGGRTYGTAITMNGQIVADYITTGTLNADLITTGYLAGTRIRGGTIDASLVNVTNLNASNITSGTIDANTVTISNLVVGSNVTMGPNATISWSNVTGSPSIPSKTSDLTNDSDFKNGTQVTQITRDTVSTEYLNAKNIHAGSVDAEDILGTTISGKTIRLLKNGHVTGILDSDGLEITDVDGAQGVFINKGLYGAALQYDGIWLNKKVSSSDPTSLTNSINIYTEGNSNHPAGLLGYYVDSNDDRHNYGVNSWGLTLDNVTSPGIFANVPNHDLNNLNNRSELMTAHAILEAISIGGGGGSGDISGSGTAGYIAKFTDTKEIGNLLAISSTGTRFLKENGTWADPTWPTWSGGTGIIVNNNTRVVTLATYGTAGTAGTSEATSGSSVSVPYVTMDAYGRVSSYGTHSHTITGFLKTAGGGTVTAGSGSDTPLVVKSNNSGSGAYIKFEDSTGAQLGYYGVSTAHKPLFNYNGTNTEISLAGHTHNYATPASITAGTAGQSTASAGSALQVPYVTVNTQGIVTGYGTHTHTVTGFVSTAGGAITKAITRDSGGSYIAARDNCVVKQTKQTQTLNTSWNPVIGVKTWAGHWSLGTVGAESLLLSYDTDANYNASNNTSATINFPPAGSTGTLALLSDIPGRRPSSPRDFANGTLITTDINYAVSGGDAFLLVIFADGYGNGRYLTLVNGYIYNNTIINCGVTNLGTRITSLIALCNGNGKLCFWFSRQSYWQSFGCECYRSNAGDYTTNHVVSVTNSADPGGTKRINIATQQTLNSAYTSEIPSKVSQLTNDSGYVASSSLKGGAYEAVSESATASTLLKRTANGYAFATYFNQSSGAETMTASSYIMYANSDGYLRKGTLASAKGALGVPTYGSSTSTFLRNDGTWATPPAAPTASKWTAQTGSLSINPNNSVHVYFNRTFSGLPVVMTSYSTSGSSIAAGDWGSIKVKNVSATGFDIVIGGSTPTSAIASWAAICLES